jgi:hypothetical protein
VWVSIGYFSGSNIDSIYSAATRYEVYFGIAVGLLILAFIGHRVWRWRRERKERAERADDGERSVDSEQSEGGEPGEHEEPTAQAG